MNSILHTFPEHKSQVKVNWTWTQLLVVSFISEARGTQFQSRGQEANSHLCFQWEVNVEINNRSTNSSVITKLIICMADFILISIQLIFKCVLQREQELNVS